MSRYTRLILTSVLAAALAGCDRMPSFQMPGSASPPAPGAGGPTTGPGAPVRPPPPRPGEANFTILLEAFRDPFQHAQQAEDWRCTLAEKVGWRDLFVESRGGYSVLCWGHYANEQQAQPNLRAAKNYKAQNGLNVFARAIIIPLPKPDIGPPEWNLKGVGKEYTLLVAVFQDVADRGYVGRQKFAIDYCRRLRDRGYEAYYLHGPVVSHVTIGAFGPEAVTRTLDENGVEKVEVVEPKIAQLQQDFPLLAHNGSGINEIVRGKDGKKVAVPKKTELVRTPHAEAPR